MKTFLTILFAVASGMNVRDGHPWMGLLFAFCAGMMLVITLDDLQGRRRAS